MINTMTSYQLIAKDLPRSLARVSKEPLVQRDSDYYLKNIGKVKSIDDFMKNDRLYKYAMKAFGLEDMAYAKAFIRKVLTEGDRGSGELCQQTDRYALQGIRYRLQLRQARGQDDRPGNGSSSRSSTNMSVRRWRSRRDSRMRVSGWHCILRARPRQ